MIIHLDAEFKRLIPALLPDEFKQLESNILQDDEIKEPLAIWKTPEGNTLLDGHNRYKIAEKHNIKFLTTEITLTDRDHAKLWILNHQLGRRNLPIGVRTALVSDVARIEEEIRRKEHSAKAGLQVSEKARLARPNTGVKKTPMLPSANPMKSKTYEAAAKRGGVPANAIRQFRSIETKAPEIAQAAPHPSVVPAFGGQGAGQLANHKRRWQAPQHRQKQKHQNPVPIARSGDHFLRAIGPAGHHKKRRGHKGPQCHLGDSGFCAGNGAARQAGG